MLDLISTLEQGKAYAYLNIKLAMIEKNLVHLTLPSGINKMVSSTQSAYENPHQLPSWVESRLLGIFLGNSYN